MGLTKIYHSIHDHHALLLKCPNEPFKCNGCKELGFGRCYECEHEECNFYLHEECANASPSASHQFVKNCHLKFQPKAPQEGERYCDACGKDVSGFVYQCTHGDPHDFHPCCLKLQRTLTAEDGMTLSLRKKLSSKCLSCGRKEISKGVKSWCYVSSCGQYCYHVACVKDMILEKWKQAHFLADGNVNEMALQILPRSQEVGLPSGGRWGRAKRTWKMAKTVIMLIISALFGEPTALISIIVEQLLSN